MEIFIKIVQFILCLSLIVILHEMGHFFFARLFKTRVERFFLFFNPWFSLFRIKRGETEYGIGWLPLGGYVKISGMIDESFDKEQLKQEPQPWEFRSKTTWQRFFIMFGGVLVNFVSALMIYILILYIWGEEYLPTENAKYGIVCDSLALKSGFRNGDKIISVDHKKIENFYKIIPYIALNDGHTVQVMRNDSLLDIPITKDVIPGLIKNKEFFDARLPFSPFVINGFSKNSPANSSGILKGDELVAINGIHFQYYDEFKTALSGLKNKKISVSVKRNGKIMERPLTVNEKGMIGVTRDAKNIFEFKTIEYGFFAAIPAGISKGYRTLGDYIKQFKLLFNPDTKAYESLGGFITIGSIFPGVWDWQAFWSLTAFISIILAFMNILPIPALDGGHIIFLAYEMITRRKPSDKFLEYAQITGMILLLTLLVYANGNDIVRLFFK